jgi:hypothetical protein
MSEQDRIIDMLQRQAVMNGDIARCQHDVNSIAQSQRDDKKELIEKIDSIESRADAVKTDLKIYKALVAMIGVLITVIAWVISNREQITGIFK